VQGAVYLLCATAALTCGVLLLRGYRRRRVRLLLWCCVFFFCLAAENAILFTDLIVVPETDLSATRSSVVLVGTVLLLYGLVWESR
jgi:hypothetical protein